MKWLTRFWYEHGDRIVFTFLAVAMCIFFAYNTAIPMKDQARDILLLICGVLINKIRTPARKEFNPEKSTP